MSCGLRNGLLVATSKYGDNRDAIPDISEKTEICRMQSAKEGVSNPFAFRILHIWLSQFDFQD